MIAMPKTERGRGKPRPSRLDAGSNGQDENFHPAYGEKTGFRKLTITLPPGAYRKLVEESARRKVEGEPNSLLSSVLREAVAEYLDRIDRAPITATPEAP